MIVSRIRRGPLLSTLLCLLILGCGAHTIDRGTVERQLSIALPVGSTTSQVLDYLDHQRIEHSKYRRDKKSGNSIQALIRDRSKWAIVRTDYGIVFRFDGHDRLESFEVHPHYTGP